MPIADGDGYLCAEWTLIRYAQKEMGSGSSILGAPWRSVHSACDSQLPDASYAIEVGRIRTAEQALWWTLHLMGKEWFEATDWETSIESSGLTSKFV